MLVTDRLYVTVISSTRPYSSPTTASCPPSPPSHRTSIQARPAPGLTRLRARRLGGRDRRLAATVRDYSAVRARSSPRLAQRRAPAPRLPLAGASPRPSGPRDWPISD